jgi:pimeloyl-ACP methyl ester carboxylesterase
MTPRSAEQASRGKDIIDLMDVLKIENAIFVGYDWGTVVTNVAAALFHWKTPRNLQKRSSKLRNWHYALGSFVM